MGAGLGVPNINNGADHSQGVGSLLSTMSLGTPLVQMDNCVTSGHSCHNESGHSSR